MSARPVISRPMWQAPKHTPWQKFKRDPVGQAAIWLYSRRPIASARERPHDHPITVVCVSDTHCTQPDVPDGDLLLHAGDLTETGSFQELQAQLDWLATLPHKHKVVIAGNHDRILDTAFTEQHPRHIITTPGTTRADLNWHDLTYLQNSSVELHFAGERCIKIYGSPLTSECGAFAFQYLPIRNVWKNNIPDDTDIVLIHGPPKGYLDHGGKGCHFLTAEIARVQPRLLVFGHIHAGHGQQVLQHSTLDRYYGKAIAGGSGWTVIVYMALCLLWAHVAAFLPWAIRSTATEKTLMVNAALGADASQWSRRPIGIEV